MSGIILCQFRIDQPEARAALTRRIAPLIAVGKARVLFMGNIPPTDRAGNEPRFDQIWAIAVDSFTSAQALVKSWMAAEASLGDASFLSLMPMEDPMMDIEHALFP